MCRMCRVLLVQREWLMLVGGLQLCGIGTGCLCEHCVRGGAYCCSSIGGGCCCIHPPYGEECFLTGMVGGWKSGADGPRVEALQGSASILQGYLTILLLFCLFFCLYVGRIEFRGGLMPPQQYMHRGPLVHPSALVTAAGAAPGLVSAASYSIPICQAV